MKLVTFLPIVLSQNMFSFLLKQIPFDFSRSS